MNWRYVNPFWHEERVLRSSLDAAECRERLRSARSGDSVARAWLARGDATFYKIGLPRYGSILELHARVKVHPSDAGSSTVNLRFSGGGGSALLLALIDLACLGAFGWALVTLVTAGWNPLIGAGLLSILIPVLLVLALRSEAPSDLQELSDFVADQVEGSAGG